LKAVYIVVQGGLGNQLWQAALGVMLQARLGVDVYYVTDAFATDGHDRSFLLDEFPALRGKALLRSAVQIDAVFREDHIVAPEVTLSELLACVEANDRVLLDGFWQRESYFQTVRDHIRRAFQREPDEQIRSQAQDHIGVHIRRFDYGHHGLVRSDYYLQSIAAIQAEKGPLPILCVTDEPNFSSYILQELPNVQVLSGDTKHPFADFQLLSACRHFVIANSSFSWWAAWFGETEDSLVYAPHPWCLFALSIDPAPARWRNISGCVQKQ
jgi:hypothetical protein